MLTTDNSTYDDATVNYAYDNIYRLTSEHRTGAHPFWNEYAYDNAGNRLTLTQKDDAGNIIGTTNSVYDAANKLQSSGNISYTWDANGNMVAKTVGGVTQTIVWDYEDKMIQLHDGTTMNFTTDGDGFRRSLSTGGTTTYFVYDRRSNTPGIAPLITETDASGATTALYTNANGLIAQTRSGTTHWYAYEAIGSTRQLTDSTGAVTDTYAFEAFGSLAASSGTTPNPFKYVGDYGYYDDGQSGMMLLGVRWYDAQEGMFGSEDPRFDETNWYGYVANDPVFHLDPKGLRGIEVLRRNPQEKGDAPNTEPVIGPIVDWPGIIHGILECFSIEAICATACHGDPTCLALCNMGLITAGNVDGVVIPSSGVGVVGTGGGGLPEPTPTGGGDPGWGIDPQGYGGTDPSGNWADGQDGNGGNGTRY